ncbi:MAG TPA: glycosyltransferase family 1 protein [Gaiellaceae bacterium]|jgi:glycosyltransferase involved in cell wall biosynthesis|nr:glycosyltransferase family 1 protein [Gaiellaceae bacterium]
MKVVVDARLEPGAAGGVVQGVLGLVHGLSRLDRDGDDYRLLVRPGRGDWLRPHAGDLEFLEAVRPETPLPPPSLRLRVARRLRPPDPGAEALVPPTKGVAEAFGADVIHLPTQQGFTTTIPTLYHPWDLQHVHYPKFFEDGERRDRDAIYRALCRQARLVVAPTRWAAEDLVTNLQVPRRKLAVIPGASPLAVYGEPTEDDLARVRAAYDLPEAFVLYPAQTWPHKNHLALVDALALLAREGVRVEAVCAGWQNDHFPRIDERAREVGVAAQLRFTGHLGGADLAALYRLARALVFPSLFEGWGFPVLEAFSFGLPVVASSTPSLREVLGDAAVTFDPAEPTDLAAKLRRVWEVEGLRRELAHRGRERSREFSWDRTARICRAHYRQVAGQRLSEEDRALVHEARA